MYYNADLLDIIEEQKEDEIGLGFIDDIVYRVERESDMENARKLKKILKKAEVWRKKHGAQFERSKYVLIHFTRNWRQSITANITINGTTINPSAEAKYLGVFFDQQLWFKAQLQHAIKKLRHQHCFGSIQHC